MSSRGRAGLLFAAVAVGVLALFLIGNSSARTMLLTSAASGTTSAPTSAPQESAQAANDAPITHALSLITEPSDGIAPVLALIASATKSVDLVMYQLEDTQVEQALAAAQARGESVRVLLSGGYYGKPDSPNVNAPAYSYLEAHGVPVHWTPSYFALTHQKTLVVDGKEALIMTFNLTPQYYASTRDFGIDENDPSDVAAIEAAFDTDWNGTKTTASNGDDLVWSPGSRSALLALIANAKQSLLVYNEEMNDAAITSALQAAAKRGVDVEIDMTYQSDWKTAFDALVAAGAHVRTYASSASLYIHAKMLLADGSEAFVGSENFSPTSLDDNRELGIMLSDSAILASLAATFNADWQNARPYGSPAGEGSAPQTSSASAAYYTSSYGASKYYYPASCSAWQSLSSKYLASFNSLSELLAQYPGRTLSPACE